MTNPNPSGAAQVFVLAGPALALLFTVFAFATGVGFIRSVWFGAALWSFLTAFSCVLWRGFRHGDWSAFNRYEFAEENGERFDWATKTGRYAHLHDLEEQELHGHDPGVHFP